MLDLSKPAVADWLCSIQPARTQADWPPPIRPIEDEADDGALFSDLQQALQRIGSDELTTTRLILSGATELASLRSMLAQLGAARLLAIATTLSELIPDPEATQLLHALRDPGTPDGRAIGAAMDASSLITLRSRLVHEQRLDTLRRAVQQTKGDAL